MQNKYFVGQDYNTIKEKNDILATYDKLQRDKLDFLNDLYDNENTLKRFWSTYIRHIRQHELALEKDVMFFDENEVDTVIASKFTYSKSMKDGIKHFIRTYKTWGMGRGDLKGNSVDAMNKNATKDSSKVLINKVWGLGEFYNLLVEIEKKSSFAGGISFLLARYGITGKQLIHMRSLRWEDIDHEKKQVRIIENERLVRIIDVDDRFLKWMDKYRQEKCADETDFGYVLKKQNKAKDDLLIENYSSINSRTYAIARDLKIPRISFGDLLKSRYIDLLLEIRATRKITSDDLEWVIMNFKETVASAMTMVTLKEYYESLTNDEIVLKNTAGNPRRSLKENNSKEIADKIRKTIKFEEFINNEEKWESKSIEEVKTEASIDKES